MLGRAVGVQTKTGPKYPSFPWPRQAHTFWGNLWQELRTIQANLTFVCSATTYHTKKIIMPLVLNFCIVLLHLNPQCKIVIQKNPSVTHWKFQVKPIANNMMNRLLEIKNVALYFLQTVTLRVSNFIMGWQPEYFRFTKFTMPCFLFEVKVWAAQIFPTMVWKSSPPVCPPPTAHWGGVFISNQQINVCQNKGFE